MRESIVWKIRNTLYVISMLTMLFTIAAGMIEAEHKDPEPEKEEFWPADMVPHPLPPWDRPKKPSEGDLA